jgi:hypothetical protein
MGGENVEESKSVARLILRSRVVETLSEGICDIRKNPAIKLQAILTSLFLMPFFALTSLLSLDVEARTRRLKTLLDCQRRMVASDTTFRRVLGWLAQQQISQIPLRLLPRFERARLLQHSLAPGGPARRIGILDGSFMGGHWLSALCLVGKIVFPALLQPRSSQGDELAASLALLKRAKASLGCSFPKLWLLDALYFSSPVFQRFRSLGAHLLIKIKDSEYRVVTKDASNLFTHFGGDNEAHGFDSLRLCLWQARQTLSSFAGFPVQVVELTETYPKRHGTTTVTCWILTTDLSLSLEELREAAHLRWQIENNLFKRLSHLSGTKRFHFKDPRPFFNLLHIFAAAVAALDAFIHILSRHRRRFKAVLVGAKFTWNSFFHLLAEQLEGFVLIRS